MPPQKHSSTHAVEEAVAHVQGASLKATATLLCEVYQLPDHQDGENEMRAVAFLLFAILFTLLFGLIGWAVVGVLIWKYWGEVLLLAVAAALGTFLRSPDGRRFMHGIQGSGVPRPTSDERKACPYCSESIMASAKICRFCNRDLPTEASPYPSARRPPQAPSPRGPFRELIRNLFD